MERTIVPIRRAVRELAAQARLIADDADRFGYVYCCCESPKVFLELHEVHSPRLQTDPFDDDSGMISAWQPGQWPENPRIVQIDPAEPGHEDFLKSLDPDHSMCDVDLALLDKKGTDDA